MATLSIHDQLVQARALLDAPPSALGLKGHDARPDYICHAIATVNEASWMLADRLPASKWLNGLGMSLCGAAFPDSDTNRGREERIYWLTFAIQVAKEWGV